MLILVKTKNGVDKAINISNVEFEAAPDQTDASKVNLFIQTPNGERIEASIGEEQYRMMIDRLSKENKLIALGE